MLYLDAGARVRHTRRGTEGSVHLVGGDPHQAEVRWDGTAVSDELRSVEYELEVLS